jgi:hypothetical protein
VEEKGEGDGERRRGGWETEKRVREREREREREGKSPKRERGRTKERERETACVSPFFLFPSLLCSLLCYSAILSVTVRLRNTLHSSVSFDCVISIAYVSLVLH